ncbi:MAG TPA: enolase C-terminal domain-like protein [Candidatus Dormibacteraeota bacterium]|nr:enolase C-terminal domain-like protein [Candidatus Dormibacteraeota bacterium]
MSGDGFELEALDVSVYEVPTEQPEADGTLQWDRTVVVVVEPRLRNGVRGVGHAWGHRCMKPLIDGTLAGEVVGRDVRDVAGCWEAMVRAIRNLGRPGVVSMAIAAVDLALWDTKARALQQPLHRLLGAVRETVPVYGSGGFTTYDERTLVAQIQGWVDAGIPRVKMKVGMDRGASWRCDLERVRAVRKAAGDGVEIFVDANGGYDRTQALRLAEEYGALGVTWFEEPVSSDDLDGLRQLRDALAMDVSAGEYGYHLLYFREMLRHGCVDVMQADVARTAGITDWLRVAALCAAAEVPFSAHCSPSQSVHPACVPPNLRHIEWFHDHVRIDSLLFDGTLAAHDGCVRPGDAPGNGMTLKRADAERWRVA